MKIFEICFVDGCKILRVADDVYTVLAEIPDEFPNRLIEKVTEIDEIAD